MRIGLWCLAYFFITGILQIAPLLFLNVSWKDFFNGKRPIVADLMGAGFVFAGIYFYYLQLRPKHFPGLKTIFKSKIGVLQGFLLGFILILIIFLLILAFNQIQVSISDRFTLLYGIQSILLFLFISQAEEIFMRGIVLRYLMLIENTEKQAILISAIIFALLHMLNPNITGIGVLNIFLAGILLAQTFIYSNFNIWVSIGLHWAWNFFQSSIFGFSVSGIKMQSLFTHKEAGQNIINGGSFGLEGSLITVFMMIIAILALYLWNITIRKKAAVKVNFG